MLSNLLTFLVFALIGLEIRENFKSPKHVVLPAACALAGMIFPALIFLLFHTHTNAWAVAMPTDVALAIGALSIVGKHVSPSLRIFLLTLAVADDFFSLLVIAIFFTSHLNLASSIYTLGAAALGALLPKRTLLIRLLSPVTTFVIIPLYIWINLLTHLNFSEAGTRISLGLIVARVVGKVCGITLMAWVLNRFTPAKLSGELSLKQIAGVGMLAGMGMTVSLVIAKITISNSAQLDQVRMGLFLTAIVSAVLGTAWLRFISFAQRN